MMRTESHTVSGAPRSVPSTPGLPWYTSFRGQPGATPPFQCDPFVSIEDATKSNIGEVFTAVVANAGIDTHICAGGQNHRLYHAIRTGTAPPGWSPIGDVTQATASAAAVHGEAIAAMGGDLHVCMFLEDGTLWHTIRHQMPISGHSNPGWWDVFGNVEAATHTNIGNVEDVSVAAAGGELHVCATTTANKLWHTIRHGDTSPQGPPGSWDPFREVAPFLPKGNVVGAGVASDGSQLHVVPVTDTGVVRHVVRNGDGTWSGADTLYDPATGKIGKVEGVAATIWYGNVVVLAVTDQGAAQLGILDLQNGQWLGFTDVEAAVGKSIGDITAGGVSADGDRMHIVLVAPGS